VKPLGPSAAREIGIFSLKTKGPIVAPMIAEVASSEGFTAKALGLDVPPTLLARADEVIE
jgi:hypothetical protein